MREFMIENGIVIDDVDSVVAGISSISGKKLSDAETIRKFVTSEKATKYYIDKKGAGKMQPDRDTIYLWIDSGYADRYGNPIMISLLSDNFGNYTGHYIGTMDVLANTIRSFFPKNSRDITRNISSLKNKYRNKIADRNHRHIDNEQEYLIMMCNTDSVNTELADLINGLNIKFEDPIEEADAIISELVAPEPEPEPDFDMTAREEEITISLLLDTIDRMHDYINDLRAELKKHEVTAEKNQELERRNKELEQAMADIRIYGEAGRAAQEEASRGKAEKPQNGHDLLGRRGRILVLGATAIDIKDMNGIAKQYGFRKDDFEYVVDYEKIVSYTGRSSYLRKYSAVILGAIPHKVASLGDWSSFTEKCKNEEGMPIAIDARSKSGELKVTKESFRETLVEICSKL